MPERMLDDLVRRSEDLWCEAAFSCSPLTGLVYPRLYLAGRTNWWESVVAWPAGEFSTPPQATIFHAPQHPFRVLGRFYISVRFSTKLNVECKCSQPLREFKRF